MWETSDGAVRVLGLARVSMLRFWARHFILTVPLSTQEYKLVSEIVRETHPSAAGGLAAMY